MVLHFRFGFRNGVWVNGKQVSSQALRDGDLVELGEVRLRFREAPLWSTVAHE
ncbi:MAG: FHA domain-containing protein [Candidatus Competibacteraceae bacterium]